MASADFPFALTKELSPGKALILSLHTVRLYLARLGWTLGFTVAGTLTARTRPLCRFVFLRSKVCFPLPSAWPRGLHPTTSALRFPTVTSIGPGRIVSSCENQPMLGTLAHAFLRAVPAFLPVCLLRKRLDQSEFSGLGCISTARPSLAKAQRMKRPFCTLALLMVLIGLRLEAQPRSAELRFHVGTGAFYDSAAAAHHPPDTRCHRAR